MTFDVGVALTWILFLALFPMSFIWLRRAWRIAVRKDYSEVALRRGESPTEPQKFATYEAAINLVAGALTAGVILSILVGQVEYKVWSAIAGLTIWGKLIASFILARHAHPIRAAGKR